MITVKIAKDEAIVEQRWMGGHTLDAQMLEVRYNGWPQRDRHNLGYRLRKAREHL